MWAAGSVARGISGKKPEPKPPGHGSGALRALLIVIAALVIFFHLVAYFHA
jgi:hypothetical protein